MSEAENRDMKLEFDEFIIRLDRMARLVAVIDDRLEGMDYRVGGSGKRNAALDEVALLTGIASDGLKQLKDLLHHSRVVVLSSEWQAEQN